MRCTYQQPKEQIAKERVLRAHSPLWNTAVPSQTLADAAVMIHKRPPHGSEPLGTNGEILEVSACRARSILSK